MTAKEFFLQTVVEGVIAERGPRVRVLELGCGGAPYVPFILSTFPDVEYVGVEPIAASYQKAKIAIADEPRAQVFEQLGYDRIAELKEKSFDVVISFSVLEHVKQLDRFIALGAKYAAPGATIVHRYDLGHALYPWSLKERVHVWLGNHVPSLLPERQFVRYVPVAEVERFCTQHHGARPFQVTYHQMPNVKSLDKAVRAAGLPVDLLEEHYAWEMTHAPTIAKLPLRTRERLFPAIAVWTKQH